MKLIACLFLIGISVSAVAQHDKREDHRDRKERMKDFMPYITRSLGGSIQSFDGLNARVANLPQYKQLKDYAATIGLGMMHNYKQIITNAGLTLGSSMSGDRDERSSTIRYIGVNADLGYDVIKDERIMLYPMIGLGAQKYQALFYRDNSAVNFNDVLNSPAIQNSISSVRFNNGFLMYRLGIGFALKSPKYPAAIGINAGYTGSFRRNDWKSNEGQTLANSPTDRVDQFYISIVLINKPWMMKM
ncbi:MAG: hypothetical protein QM764_02435 [Chitinophagaceae bacterium]